jgi:hypothetical protein
MQGQITDLFSYPIKGFSPSSLDSVDLRPNDGFPGDRVFGFAKADSGFDPANPRPLPKNRFLVLMQHAKIAALKTTFDPDSGTFIARLGGDEALNVDLNTSLGRDLASSFLTELLDLKPNEAPFFASSEPHRFTDVSVVSPKMMNAVSLINLASVRAFEQAIGRPVHPMRFRANIYFDGWPPFAELDAIDRHFTIGDMEFKAIFRTRRCAATQVDPDTAERDIPVPELLLKHYGHSDMGVYAEVLGSGRLTRGMPITIEET